MATTIVAAITSQLRYAELPGNVRLRRREGGLPKASVVNVTQLATVDRGYVEARLGQLSPARLSEVWRGIRIDAALLSLARPVTSLAENAIVRWCTSVASFVPSLDLLKPGIFARREVSTQP